MENKDMPAMPQSATNEGHGCNYTEYFNGEVPTGLTKREMFAMHALSSVLDMFNPYEQGNFDSSDYADTAKHAVGLADALLAELDK